MQVTARLYPTGISVISKCDVTVIVSFWIVIKLKKNAIWPQGYTCTRPSGNWCLYNRAHKSTWVSIWTNSLMVKNTLIFKCEKLAQRLHCVCRLRLFEVSSVVMGIFCNSVLESLIRYEMTAWFGSLTVNSESKIKKLIKTTMKGKGNKEKQFLECCFV